MSWQDDPVVGTTWGQNDPIVARPPVDQSTLDPRDAQARRPMVSAKQLIARLPGVPASVTQSVDQEVGRNRSQYEQDAAKVMTAPGIRAVRGFADMAVLGPAQVIANMTPYGNKMNELLQADERNYQQQRADAGQTGFDAMRALGGAGAVIAPSRYLNVLKGANMGSRAVNAGVQGAVGGAAMPVLTGDDYWGEKGKQVAIGTGTGLLLAPALEPVIKIAAAAVNAGARGLGKLRGAATPADVDAAIESALAQHSPGIRFKDLAADVQESIRQQVRQAGNVAAQNPKQIAAAADITAVGATPTRGSVSLDPVAVSREKNLAKMGANSDDPALQRLAQLENENNAALVRRLDSLQGGSAADEFSTGALAVRALKGQDDQAQSTVSRLYKEAEAINGGEVALDGARFVDQATRAIDKAQRGAFLPGQVRTVMQGIMENAQKGVPLTVDGAEQLRTILAAEGRKAARSGDGNAEHAIKLVRDALENTQPVNLQGKAATDAYAKARTAHRARMKMQDDSPALAAAVDGAEPDKFVQKYIIGQGASVADVAQLRRGLNGDPEALTAVRGHLIDWLRKQSVTGAAEAFSPAAFNKSLNNIGDRKLGAFFSPDEIAQLRQLGRAGANLKAQPVGSAVNNSNSGALVAAQANNWMQRAADSRLLGMLPLGAGPTLRGLARTGATTKALDAASDEANALLKALGDAPPPQAVNANELLRLLAPAGAVGATAFSSP